MKPLLIIICTLAIINASAQEDGEVARETFHLTKYRITTDPLQFLFLNINVTAEKVINNRHTIGITLAYRPGLKKTGPIDMYGMFGGAYDKPHFNLLYNGTTGGINSRYYFVRDRSFYLDARVFYRYWWFSNKYVDYNYVEPGGQSINATRTEHIHVTGIKALVGKSFTGRVSNKTNGLFDIYMGIGFRHRSMQYETHNGTVNEKYYTYRKEKRINNLPTIHLGMNIGIGR